MNVKKIVSTLILIATLCSANLGLAADNEMSSPLLNGTVHAPDFRIWYGSDVNQFGDIRLPEGKGPFPLAVVIHGGFWRSKYNLDHISHLCESLRDMGIATWSLEYRRIGNFGGGYPGIFNDIGQGIDIVSQLADKIGQPAIFDLDKLVVMGHSAGGHLAVWAASRQNIAPNSLLAAKKPLKIKQVISLAGLLDLHYAADEKLSNSAVAELFSGYDRSRLYQFTSPIEMLPIKGRVFLVHGDNDTNVPFAISQRYQQQARHVGMDVTLVPLKGAGHFDLIDPSSDYFQEIKSLLIFLTQ